MKFVVQYNLMNEESLRKISTALLDHHIPHSFVGVIPFSREITCNEKLEGTEFLPYGSTTLTIETHKLGWRGQYFDPKTFRAEEWQKHHSSMLNSAPAITVSDGIKLLRSMQPGELVFTRPTEDLKAYSGQVIEVAECAEWLESALTSSSSGNNQLQADTPIIISPPRNIQAEWRWFIVGGKIVDGSMYRRGGQLIKQHVDPDTDTDLIAEAQSIADIWLPQPCCVMDLALVDDEVKLLEFNTINAAGFYDHNVNLIIKTLWDYFVKTSPG